MGTSNISGWCGVESSLSLLAELGIVNIEEYTRALSAEAWAMLERHNHVVIGPAGAGPIVTFASGVSAAETDRVVSYLQSRHVTVVKHLDRSGVPHIRLSFHAYNTRAELHEFEQILQDAYAAL
jgi:selenocysteine lyase/cysteine desulfurase